MLGYDEYGGVIGVVDVDEGDPESAEQYATAYLADGGEPADLVVNLYMIFSMGTDEAYNLIDDITA